MIAGAQPPPPRTSRLERVLLATVIHAILHLPLLFFGALLLAGVLGLIDLVRGGGRFAELWVCLPPALLVAGIAAYGVRHLRRLGRRTIRSFRYADDTLAYCTADGDFLRAIADVASVSPLPRPSRGQAAHRIRFHDGNWVLLLPDTENASALVEQLLCDLTKEIR
jgi:hypothetical protein